jgi:hypothetical protein
MRRHLFSLSFPVEHFALLAVKGALENGQASVTG